MVGKYNEMKYLLILLILFSCSQTDEVTPYIFGVYNDSDSGVLIVNEKYIEYRGTWHTQEYRLTQDSLIFHVSRAKDCCPDEIITWWFELQISKDVLKGNNYKTANFNPDFKDERGMIYFRKYE